MSRRIVLCGLVLLMVSVACGDTSCGGCVEPPAEPFPTAPRVYDGVQMRITQTGFGFIEDNIPVILATLLQDGLTFEITKQEPGLGLVICDTPCQLQAEIVDAALTLVPPGTIVFDGHVSITGDITMDAPIIAPCTFPLTITNKPISTTIALQVDSFTWVLQEEGHWRALGPYDRPVLPILKRADDDQALVLINKDWDNPQNLELAGLEVPEAAKLRRIAPDGTLEETSVPGSVELGPAEILLVW
ncbi:hypothetical protein ACFL2F_03640 [Myxococcota bacterium]